MIQLESLAFVIALVPTTAIAAAVIVVALIIIAFAVIVLRGNKKKREQATSAGSANDWQRQAQPGAAGAWNQQPAWNQQGAQGQQMQQPAWGTPGASAPDAANSWGAPAQQQQPNPWGAPAQQQPANAWDQQQQQQPNPNSWVDPNTPQQQQWGAPAQQQQPANAWADPNAPQQQQWGAPAQQQQPANAWADPNAPQQQQWGAPAQQQQPSWGTPGQNATQPASPWADPNAPQQQQQWGAPAPAAQQDPWAQQPAQNNAWGAQPNNAMPSQPNAFGGNSGSNAAWGQAPAQPEAWNAPAAQPPFQSPSSPNNNPAWQQQPAALNQHASGAGFGIANNESDKTMLRPAGAPGGLGMVRVEEGKEPGRIYEVRKESLSIGRSRESDIFLEDLAVSRLHASIVNMGNGNYVLKDEGSANGTKVNGQLVNKFQTYPLQEGDRIQMGQTVLVFARH